MLLFFILGVIFFGIGYLLTDTLVEMSPLYLFTIHQNLTKEKNLFKEAR
jgi:hypothetical protein